MKLKIYEGTEDEEIIDFMEEDRTFYKIYKEKFGFEFYGTNEEVFTKLKEMFTAAEEMESSGSKGYSLNYEDIGKSVNNMEFVIFVMWFMNEKNLLNYGTSPRNSWCWSGVSDDENDGYIIMKYFIEHDVEWIEKIIDIDENYLEEQK